MYILGIDTSCDDTCIALLEIRNWKLEILSNVVSSQVKLHAKYGGVYPMLAKREHQRNLPMVLKRVLKGAGFANPKFQAPNPKQIPNSKFQIPKIDLIAVTVGPGLEPCLWQGVNFAKEIAQKFKKPLIPVNHVESHILANWLNTKYEIQNTRYLFPAVCLVVSGGHTQLVLMRNFGKYQILGETRDDAAGECFDKAARILGLGYPGGPAIAAEAAMEIRSTKYEETKKSSDLQTSYFRLRLPRPMMHTKDYDFSFSGLKTAILYKVRSMKSEETKKKEFIREMCAEVQQAIIDVLIRKTLKAAKDFRVKTIILGGGVVANEELRKQFQEKIYKELPNIPARQRPEPQALAGGQYLIPSIQFCTDNAAMVAVTAYFHQKEATKNWQEIKADANIKI